MCRTVQIQSNGIPASHVYETKSGKTADDLQEQDLRTGVVSVEESGRNLAGQNTSTKYCTF